jgi:hypothetical protein
MRRAFGRDPTDVFQYGSADGKSRMSDATYIFCESMGLPDARAAAAARREAGTSG